MSGLCGLIDFGAGFHGAALRARMLQMQQAMIHRGFERDAIWVDPTERVALSDAHLLASPAPGPWTRGAVVAATDFGATEPAAAHGELPAAWQAVARVFDDSSSSPVRALREVRQPFAVALWNERLKKLLLARDAFDARPLHFAAGRGWLAFASELRALRTIPGFDFTVDRDAIRERLGGGPRTARTIHRGANRVAAGGFIELDCAPLFASASLLSIRAGDAGRGGAADLRPPACPELRSSSFHSAQPDPDPLLEALSRDEKVELLRRALLEALHGADAAAAAHVLLLETPADHLLAAMCRAELGVATHTHALSAPGVTSPAAELARTLGSSHHAVEPPADFPELLNRVATALDEPFAPLAAAPLQALAGAVRGHTPLAISGIGAAMALAPAAGQRGADASTLAPWSTEDLRAAGFSPEIGAGADAPPAEPGDRAELAMPGVLNQICMHHSLAVATPFLKRRVRRVAAANTAAPDGEGVMPHLLRRYLPETLVRRLLQPTTADDAAPLERELMSWSETLLFEPSGRVLALTGRIELRGLLACPAPTARIALERRWALLVLESWLRRQPATGQDEPLRATALAG